MTDRKKRAPGANGAKQKGSARAPAAAVTGAKSYTHPDATSALRPDVSVQAQFRKKKPLKTYCYDSSFVIAGLLLCPFAWIQLSAQSIKYEGIVVNHGRAASPSPNGTAGTLSITTMPSKASPFQGEVAIGAPLGGSGPASIWSWGDSLLGVSVSATGDTIVWLGQRDGSAYVGSYLIPGGVYADQGGRWAIRQVSSQAFPHGRAPEAGIRDWLNRELAPLEQSIPAPELGTAGEDVEPTQPPASQENPFDAIVPLPPELGSAGEDVEPTQPPASQENPFDAILPPRAGGPTTGTADRIALGLLVAAIVGSAWLIAKRKPDPSSSSGQAKGESARATPRAPHQGGGYAISCPSCGKANIAEARKLWFVQGFIFAIRFGQRTIVGCPNCVRQEGMKALGLNLLAGWWSAIGIFATPIVVLQNLVELFGPPAAGPLEEMLRQAGLDPDEVRLDADGFTREQRRLVDAASYVLATAIWADGHAAPVEYARALSILQQFTDGRLTPEAAAAQVAKGKETDPHLEDLPLEMRETLLRMALDIALADGQLGLPEVAMLHSVAKRLGFPPGAVDALIAELTGARRSGRGAEGAEPTGSQDRSRRSDGDPGPRRPRRGVEDLGRARTVMGVPFSATLIDLKKAYREAIFQCHPDRAGPDLRRQAEFTRRTQELNWAYTALRRAAEVEMQG